MKVPTFIVVAALCQGCVITQCVAADEVTSNAHVYQHGVVAADHSAASEAGAKILREGGNVVDAAVATSFALSVVRPASCGIGGGGFMVIWDAKKQRAVALDYRERAPANVSAQDYGDAADAGKDEPVSVRGGMAVGVPGTAGELLCFRHCSLWKHGKRRSRYRCSLSATILQTTFMSSRSHSSTPSRIVRSFWVTQTSLKSPSQNYSAQNTLHRSRLTLNCRRRGRRTITVASLRTTTVVRVIFRSWTRKAMR